MSSYGVWWIEIVVALGGVMCLALLIRETAAFISVRRLRRRDGGVPVPRTKEEYLLLFPHACPRCLSRGGKRVKGWHVDRHGTSEFVDTWQCAQCAYVEGGNRLSPMRDTDIIEQSVMARPRWFLSPAEAERIVRPQLGSQDFDLRSDAGPLPPSRG